MQIEFLAYPFIFAAIYFEAFFLVTFLSAPARESRARRASKSTPAVAMIVPCYNEETTVGGTVESLLALDYPTDRLSIILVNDGSTDNTRAIMDTFAGNPQIQIIHKENGGKHSAINAGIELSGQMIKGLEINVRYDNIFSTTGYMNQMVSAKLKMPL